MAGLQHWSDGFGGTSGDAPLATAKDIYLSADAGMNVYFVNSVTGNNANAGTRDDPFATYAKAKTVITAGDVVVILKNHVEEITGVLSLAIRHYVIGEGRGSERPLFIPNQLIATEMFSISAPVHFHGIRVGETTNGPNAADCIEAKVAGAQGTRFNYCEFTSGDLDTGVKLNMNTTASFVDNCEFIAAGTSYDNRPLQALKGARNVRGTKFTGGVYGWQNANTMVFGWSLTASGPVGIAPAVVTTSVIQCELTSDAYFSPGVVTNYQVFPDGLGLQGHPIISGKGLFIGGSSAQPSYVNSVTGSDAAGYGLSRGKPYATLKYAVDTATAAGLLVVAQGHLENITTEITVNTNGTVIVGEGAGTVRPKFTRTANIQGVGLNHAEGALLCNVQFAKSTVATGLNLITCSLPASLLDQVDITVGEDDNGDALHLIAAAHHCLILSTSFTSSADTNADQPTPAFSTAACNNPLLLNCSFDGGNFGWNNNICADPDPNYITMENLSLRRDSIVLLDLLGYFVNTDVFIWVSQATGSSGIVNINTG